MRDVTWCVVGATWKRREEDGEREDVEECLLVCFVC